VVKSSAADEMGNVRGVVRFDGAVPKAEAADETGRKRDLFEVHTKSHGLRDAVVYWIDAPAEASPSITKDWPIVVVDQKDLTFVPHVVSVQSGQPVSFTNSDSANHNVRTAAFEAKNQFNVFTGAGNSYVHRFVTDKKQRPTRLGCDIHAWMSGWVYAFDHPHHTVTDAEGRFELPQLPVGKHRLAIRQPDGNLRRDVAVEVIAAKTTKLEIDFRDADLTR
jgi:plastocyanin